MEGGIWKLSVLPLQFFCKFKIVLKNNVCLFKVFLKREKKDKPPSGEVINFLRRQQIAPGLEVGV